MKGNHLLLAVLLMLVIPAGSADGQLVGVTSRAALGGNDFVDWIVLGTGPFVYPMNPFSIQSTGGIGIEVSNASPSIFMVRVQGVNWGGDFAPGDVLLANTSDNFPGAFTLVLDTPVSAVGTQINVFEWAPFDATIEAIDSGGISLGIVAFTGLQITPGGNNTAPFIGIQSSSADIATIIIDAGTEAMVINQVDCVTPENPFIRGDANADGTLDVADVITSIGYLFSMDVVPCQVALDANDNGVVNIGDPVWLLYTLFSGGPPPPPPYPACGLDPTADPLDCGASPACP